MPPPALAVPSSDARPGAPRAFFTVWAGQTVSHLGSGLTSFALGVWVYQRTGSVSLYALIITFATVPAILAFPLSGAVVDRHDRRLVMLCADAAAGLASLGLAALVAAGMLRTWHVAVAVALASVCVAFHRPAWSASTTLLVPERHLSRAAGLVRLGQGSAEVLAPIMGGVLLAVIGLAGVIALDVASFAVAVLTLAIVRFPGLPPADGERPSIVQHVREGWRYMGEHRQLLALTLFLATLSLTFGFCQPLLVPMVLSFTGTRELGVILSVGVAGTIAGSALATAWGGPKRRIRAAVACGWIFGLGIVATGARASAATVAGGLFVLTFALPLLDAWVQAHVQATTPPAMQGRVFAGMRMISWGAAPVAYLTAGPLADRVFGGLLRPGGALAPTLGPLLGVGNGRGIGLLIICAGLAALACTGAASFAPALRQARE